MSFPDPETKLFDWTSWDVFLVSLYYCVYNTCSDIQCIKYKFSFVLNKTLSKVVKWNSSHYYWHEIEKCDKILSLFKVLLYIVWKPPISLSPFLKDNAFLNLMDG